LFKDNFKEFLKNTNNFEICQNIYEQLKEVKPKNAYDEEIKQNLEFVLPMTSFIVGGDGWAYDIDFGGLDHVVSLNKNVNILILDNELYANTGGQTILFEFLRRLYKKSIRKISSFGRYPELLIFCKQL